MSTAARGSGERRLPSSEPGTLRLIANSVLSAPSVPPRSAAVARPARPHELPEARVGQVLRDPLGARERQRPEVEVLRAPAEHRRVERDHDRLAPDRRGARQEGVDQLLVGAPVQLEPARRVAHHRRAVLHRRRRLVGEHVRQPERRRRPRDRRSASGCTSSDAPTGATSTGAGSARPNSSTVSVPAARRRAASAARSPSARTRRGWPASSRPRPPCRRSTPMRASSPSRAHAAPASRSPRGPPAAPERTFATNFACRSRPELIRPDLSGRWVGRTPRSRPEGGQDSASLGRTFLATARSSQKPAERLITSAAGVRRSTSAGRGARAGSLLVKRGSGVSRASV